MTEENELVQQEVAQNEPEQHVEEVKAAQELPKPKSAERNWEATREVLELQKQRIRDLEAKVAQQAPPAIEEKDEFDSMDPNDSITVEQARKLVEKRAEKKAEQAAKKIVQEFAQSQQIALDEERSRNKYEDYDYVVKNFAVPLIQNDPALAYQIRMSKNPAETAYKIGKLSDQYEESMNEQKTSPKAEKIMKNASRPVSSNAVGSSLKSKAEDYSKLSPSQVWQMSQEYARKA